MGSDPVVADPHVALVTIGQSPREDIASALRPALGAATLVQAGALDHLGTAEIEALAPDSEDLPLVSKLRDGREVVVGKRRLMPHLSAALDRMSPGAAVVAVLCSGTFPELEQAGRSDGVPLVLPEAALRARLLHELSGGGRMGLVAPLAAQADKAGDKWRDVTDDVRATFASPYGADHSLREAATWLAGQEPDLVLLDCMGYVERHRALVADMFDVPVLSACSALAEVLAGEVVG